MARQLVTADELLLMGSDAQYELVDGVLVDVPLSWIKPSIISARICMSILHSADSHNSGIVTGAAGGYILSTNPDTVVAPDVGFVSRARCPAGQPDWGFFPAPPDLAVEVISANHDPAYNAQKQALYAKAGVPLVWWVDPERKAVTVYRLGQAPEVVEGDGVLDGGDVLPGFELKLQSIFRD